MAGWRRKNSYTWGKKNAEIKIIGDYTKNGLHATAYIVEFFNIDNNNHFEKTFKTRKEALNYIEKYMRTN